MPMICADSTPRRPPHCWPAASSRPRPGARLPGAHRRARWRGPCLRAARCGRGAGAGARARRRAVARPAARPAARREGPVRHRRPAHRLRLADLCRPPPGDRRSLGGPVPRSRRGGDGQDRHHRVRLLPARPHAQPAQPGAHAGRLVQRLGRGRGRLHGAAGPGHADRRLDHPAGRLLRRGRLQAQLGPRRRAPA